MCTIRFGDLQNPLKNKSGHLENVLRFILLFGNKRCFLNAKPQCRFIFLAIELIVLCPFLLKINVNIPPYSFHLARFFSSYHFLSS